MLLNIDHALTGLFTAAIKRKILDAAAECKKSFESCFVRAGEKKKLRAKQPNRGLLNCANDWKLLVDYDHRQYVFPPFICATNEPRCCRLVHAMSRSDLTRAHRPC